MADEEDFSNFSLMDLFRIEVENHASSLENGLVTIEKDSSPKNIEPLMRAAHSIKGAARVVGLDYAVKLAHSMEDVLSAAQKGNIILKSDDIDTLLKGSDFFKTLATFSENEIPDYLNTNKDEIDTLSSKLSDILTEKTNSASEIPEKTAEQPVIDKQEEIKIEPEKINIKPLTETIQGQKQPIIDKPQKAAGKDKNESAFIRIQSENLSKIMGLAGETYIQSKYVKNFSGDLLYIKNIQGKTADALEKIIYEQDGNQLPEIIKQSINISVKKLNDLNGKLSEHLENLQNFFSRLENITTNLYDESIKSKMRPFTEGVQGFKRMVRDLAKSLNKQVNLIIKGEMTNVDRDILEKLESPLNHIIRNAVDHGLETPDARVAVGKNPEGTITIEARHSSGMLIISVSDDGKGIDTELIRRKIIEKGYVTGDIAEKLTNVELLEFLFLPGFSTARKVTEISGRGVGLDVVFSMVQEVRGSVRIESQKGLGTTFLLHLPITLSVLNTLVVSIANELYALPLSRIDRILKITIDDIKIIENKQYCVLDDENIGIISASQVLHAESAVQNNNIFNIIIISDRLNRYGIVIDEFIGKYELSIKPLDYRLGKVQNVAAGAIMEDGSPVLILDIDDLVRSIDNILSEGSIAKLIMRDIAAKRQKKRILVVDDSITVREVERKILENKGYDVTLSVDGMDAWNKLHTHQFDLVVSDVDMPRMNGIELVTKIKSEINLKDIPVMIISYKDREEDKIRGLEAGANYYLTKSSFHDESLVNAVMDLIGRA